MRELDAVKLTRGTCRRHFPANPFPRSFEAEFWQELQSCSVARAFETSTLGRAPRPTFGGPETKWSVGFGPFGGPETKWSVGFGDFSPPASAPAQASRRRQLIWRPNESDGARLA